MKKKKLSTLISSASRNAGGVFEVVRCLNSRLDQYIDNQVLSIVDECIDDDLDLWGNTELILEKHIGPRSLLFSPGLIKALRRENPDIVHVHGIWQGTSLASLKYHKGNQRPYIISPHGMLDPWAIRNSRWKKEIVGRWYEYEHLKSASCIHALCESEYDSIRQFGLTNPVCIIPNGIDLPSLPSVSRSGKNVRNIVFIGRIHPKKGIKELITAWSKQAKEITENWNLVIAGWSQLNHQDELIELCDNLDIANQQMSVDDFVSQQSSMTGSSVYFVGPVFGEQKNSLLQVSDVFALTSFSEGLPMSILEAWSYCLPVLITPFCNLPEGKQEEAAIEVIFESDVPNSIDIVQGLQVVMEMSDDDRIAMGMRGRKLVENKFTWDHIAKQMNSVYDWLLGKTEKPKCVKMK